MRKLILWLVVAGTTLSLPPAGLGDDWPQFQYNAASQGRTPRAVEPPFQLRWVWYGDDNVAVGGRPYPRGEVPRPPRETVGLLSLTMHPVVADGRVLFGDLPGTLYCLSSADGSTAWSRQFPGAFVHTPAIHRDQVPSSNVIVAPCQDGCLYGIDWQGNILWTVRADRPFVTPAKVADATIYAGSLDGKMYAVDVRTGEVAWTFDAGAAIRQPAAIAEGKVFFGSEDMIFHALNARTGEELWRTEKGQLTGQSFRNTWPVVVGDKVMTFQILVDGHAEYIMEALLFNATPGNHTQKRLEDWPREREAILNWLAGDQTFAVDCNKYWEAEPGKIRANSRGPQWAGGPLRKSLYVFDVDGDGQGRAVEPYQVPMGIVGGTGNSNMGPAMDAQGRPILWWRVSASSIITGGGFGTAFSPDLSGLELATGDRIILPTSRDPQRGGPGMELDNHHLLTSAGEYLYYHNPFRQARWVKLDGRENPSGNISAVYGRHDGGDWHADVVYYATKEDAGPRGDSLFDSHGAARTPVVIADGALFVNEIDIRAVACYEPRQNGRRELRGGKGAAKDAPPQSPADTTVGWRGCAAERLGQSVPADDSQRNPQTPVVDAARYIWEERVVRDYEAESADLRRILEEQLRLVVHSGHLLPYYCKRGELNPRWYFTNPGDTVAAVSRAYPFVSGELQNELRNYLQREMAAYPPCSDGLNAPSDPGTSRMDFVVPEQLWEWHDGRLYRSLPRVHNVYALWLYANATGDVGYVREHWNEIRRFYTSHRHDRGAYLGGPGAPIAMARLAYLVGDDAQREEFQREALATLASVEHEPRMREEMLRRYGFDPRWSGEFNLAGFHLLGMSPEVARYIRHHADVKVRLLAHVNRATLQWPMWFLSQGSAFSRYYGESHALSPLYSAMIFPIKALVDESPPQPLWMWIDAEDAPRGDLFFIERLVLAIEASGQEEWLDVRHNRDVAR